MRHTNMNSKPLYTTSKHRYWIYNYYIYPLYDIMCIPQYTDEHIKVHKDLLQDEYKML